MTRNLTASQLPIAALCPGALVLPRTRAYPENAACAFGSGVHKFIEDAHARGVDAAVAALAVDAPWRRTCLGLRLGALPPGRSEVTYVLDVAAGTAREVGARLARKYPEVTPDQVLGTADWVAPNCVIDFKVHLDPTAAAAGDRAADHLQLRALAAAYALATAGVGDAAPTVEVGLVHIAEDGSHTWDRATLDWLDHAETLGQLRAIQRRVAAAGAAAAAGQPLDLVAGQHCGRCDAYERCPTQRALFATFVATPDADDVSLDDGAMARAWERRAVAQKRLDAIDDRLRDYVRAGNSLTLSTGRVVSYDGRAVRARKA